MNKDFKEIAQKIYQEKYDSLFFYIFLQGFLEGSELKISSIFKDKQEIEELMRK